MFLKSISLNGFKSFGVRTTLELDQGITVIVGPNGSGKSNIVEAVAWATGGQSTRGLRADRTDELLFCGAAGLPEASRAEVTLVFDNSSGLLPIDRPEVAITRRHYRSGESQFEINRVSCRLMDITELLSEAGLRRSRHVILGQGQVEQVLNASPDEHRRVLEEAAGVGKHLWRRDRAVRRLRSTRSDLERIGDLIAHKQRRVRPLRRQARALERHSRLTGEIRGLRLFLEGEKLRGIEKRLRSAVDSRQEWEAVRSQASDRRARCLEMLSTVEAARQSLRVGAVGDLMRDWEMVSERMKRLAEVAALRAEARGHQRRARHRRRVLAEERAGLGDSLAEMDRLLAAAEDDVERCRLEAVRLADRAKEISALIDAATGAEMKVPLGEQATLRAAADRDRRERSDMEVRLAEVASAMEELGSRASDMEARQAAQKKESARRSEEMVQVRTEAEEKRWTLREAESLLASARSAMAEAAGTLESVRRALGPGSPDRRKRLESFTGWSGWVAELLRGPSELAAAVEAGLEAWAEAAAFEGPVALGAALDRLGKPAEGEGPVSMVSALFPGTAEVPARSVAASGSRVTPLVDLLPDGEHFALAVRLLGDVVLVDDWKKGWGVVERHPRLRAVTPDGDLITVRGISLGGGNRLPDLAAAKAETEAATEAFESRRREVNRLRREAERLDERREEQFGVLQRGRQELMESRREAERIAARRREMGREEDRLKARLESLTAAEEARSERLAELAAHIDSLEGRAETPHDPESLSRRLEKVSRARAAAEEEYRSATAARTGLAERRRLERARYEQVAVELAEVSHLPEDLPETPAEEVAGIAGEALELLAVHHGSLAELDRAARRRARDLAAEAAEAKKAIEDADQRQREATDELETLIAEVSRLKTRRQAILEALWELDADPDEEYSLPSSAAGDPRDALASATAELGRMRPINPYASADLSALEKEMSELCDQRDDIARSDQRLGKVIAELEKEAAERYLATFRETAKAFEQTFGQVFPGGRGRLGLVDPADPLGSGVEIIARPQGKRVSRLSLLSGGERALGALAFLFALMKTRPAPFYLLDEMDATLDAANLYRVLELVRQLRSDAQILIITHQPQTAEFAEVLYGVTLPPGGATQVVSRRMDRTGARVEDLPARGRTA